VNSRKNWLVLIPIILITLIYSFRNTQPLTPLEQGIKVFKDRAVVGDSIYADTAKVNEALSLFEQAVTDHPDKAAAGYYLLRAIYFKGMYTDMDKHARKNLFERGRQEGQHFYDVHPKDPRILFWYAANLAKWADATSVIRAAKNGTAQQIRELGHELVSVDSTFQGAGGYRLLAQVHYYTPSIPLVLKWPSLDDGLTFAQKALAISQEHPANFLIYAQILEEQGDHEKAHQNAHHIMQMPMREGYEVEDQYIRSMAKDILNHTGEYKSH
jgi:tetratricopeptide (TPR) repeat protein